MSFLGALGLVIAAGLTSFSAFAQAKSDSASGQSIKHPETEEVSKGAERSTASVNESEKQKEEAHDPLHIGNGMQPFYSARNLK